MELNDTIKTNPRKPIEQHNTAAWANEHGLYPVSKVNIPSEMAVIEAKEFVEENQK